jgi:hypothetical protein
MKPAPPKQITRLQPLDDIRSCANPPFVPEIRMQNLDVVEELRRTASLPPGISERDAEIERIKQRMLLRQCMVFDA